ncbi:MAG: SIS domain-containing protein [Candidatus Riflebacteria bacterium]|nr:SIS domain-containing protein [Candidatus Riflebacteria bacterium]
MEDLAHWIRLYLDEKIGIARQFPVDEVVRLTQAVIRAYDNDGAVYIFANGGPAGAAEGFATDLKTHPFVAEDKTRTTDLRRLTVHCLNESAGVITGVANDLGHDAIFVEQLKNHLRGPERNRFDLVIGLSGSGNSRNVLEALRYAKSFGATTACVCGRGGGKAREVADLCVIVPGRSTFPGQTGANDNNFHIEDFQTSVSHMVTGLLKRRVWAGR